MERLLKKLGLFVLIGLTASAPTFGAGVSQKIPSDTIQFGKYGSTSNKSLVFDFGLGASNPSLFSDSATNSLNFNKNSFLLGDGLSSTKNITANLGLGSANPKISFNSGNGDWEFSNDGANFTPIGTGSGASGIQLLTNPGFESGVTLDWTNTGGTFAASSVSPLVGRQSALFTASASGQSFQSGTHTIPVGLQGQSCVGSLMYTGGDAGLTLQVLNGSSVVLASQVLSAAASSTTVNLPFLCPGSGSVQLKVISTASAAQIKADNMFLGQNTLVQVAQASIYGTALFPAVSSCQWAVTTNVFSDPAAVTACSLPTVTGNLAASVAKTPTIEAPNAPSGSFEVVYSIGHENQIPGTCQWGISDESNTMSFTTFSGSGTGTNYTPSVLHAIFNYSTPGSHTFKLRGKSVDNTSTCQVYNDVDQGGFIVKYFPSSSQTLQAVNTQAASWTGYHNTSCVWAQASTTPADFTDAAGGCALVQRTNHNMGSVTTVGTVRPGITWQSAAGKTWRVCAAPLTVASVGSYGQFLLTDLSGNFLGGLHHNNNAEMSQNFCVDYDATTSGSQGVKFQGLDNVGGSSSAIIEGIGSLNAIEWSLLDTTQSLPGAVLTGSVMSPSSGVENVVRLKITDGAGGACTTSPCSVENSNNSAAISSVTRASAGSYAVNFATGIFSGTPVCTCSGGKSGTDGATVTSCGNTNSTTVAIDSISASTAALTDNFVSLICVGPK